MDLEAVYREHSLYVYCCLYAKTGSAELAEELTQETFYQAVRSIDRFDGSSKITTSLFGIAKNVWLNEYRRRNKAPVILPESETVTAPSAESDVLARMGREEILRSIHRVPDPGPARLGPDRFVLVYRRMSRSLFRIPLSAGFFCIHAVQRTVCGRGRKV